MDNTLLIFKKREQELMAKLGELSADADEVFICLRKIMSDRAEAFAELEVLQKEMNLELVSGEQMILDDLRSGKVGLINTETGQPMTVALFAKR